MSLLIAPCSHAAANFAVENWHYSHVLPYGKLVKYGAWENEKLVGVVIFSKGASPFLGNALDLEKNEICELTRVAFQEHQTPISQIVSQSLKFLKQNNNNLRVVASFANPRLGHHGGIYQAGNWIFTGKSADKHEYFIDGRWRIERSARRYEGFNKEPSRFAPGKYRYLYPFDRQMRRKIEKLSQPYPRAVEGSEVSRDASGVEGQVRSLPTALKV